MSSNGHGPSINLYYNHDKGKRGRKTNPSDEFDYFLRESRKEYAITCTTATLLSSAQSNRRESII